MEYKINMYEEGRKMERYETKMRERVSFGRTYCKSSRDMERERERES